MEDLEDGSWEYIVCVSMGMLLSESLVFVRLGLKLKIPLLVNRLKH